MQSKNVAHYENYGNTHDNGNPLHDGSMHGKGDNLA